MDRRTTLAWATALLATLGACSSDDASSGNAGDGGRGLAEGGGVPAEGDAARAETGSDTGVAPALDASVAEGGRNTEVASSPDGSAAERDGDPRTAPSSDASVFDAGGDGGGEPPRDAAVADTGTDAAARVDSGPMPLPRTTAPLWMPERGTRRAMPRAMQATRRYAGFRAAPEPCAVLGARPVRTSA